MIPAQCVCCTRISAMMNNIICALAALPLIASIAWAGVDNVENLIADADDWKLGFASSSSAKPIFNATQGSISNQTPSISYGIYNFDTPLVLESEGDCLDFQFTLNIAYTGVPYGSSPGIGILTLYGDTNIHAGLGGIANGQFNATTSTEIGQNAFTFSSSHSSGTTNLAPTLSASNAIPKLQDSTISGHIKWNAEAQSFAVHFSIGEKEYGSLTLPDELRFTGLGFTLCGPGNSTATISNIMLNYSSGLIPEPSTSTLALAGITLLSLHRRRQSSQTTQRRRRRFPSCATSPTN